MENSLFKNVYNPDVLSCIANLSNDEVFTPPELANKIIDMLPQELFENPDTTFLDPCCKSGVFLREIAKRLIKELEPQIPDLEKRIEHIFSKQLFGISITELTSLLSRRSVYCSKFPSSEFSAYQFPEDKPQGNIIYQRIQHTWKDGKCIYCGASQSEYDRGTELETHAYQFIHNLDVKKVFNMKFDVIIGNPPYQMSDGGSGTGISAKPIYHHFVLNAKMLMPRYLTMIIPSRWFAGGKGLDEFREEMLHDKHMRIINDFMSSKDCFPGVNIAGGVNYFLWDSSYNGECEIRNCGNNTETIVSTRKLDEFDMFIRDNRAISIIHKFLKSGDKRLSDNTFTRNPFGYVSKERGEEKPINGIDCIKLISSGGEGYVPRTSVLKNHKEVRKYKVTIGKVVPSNGEVDTNPQDGYKVTTSSRILLPDEVTTESYLMLHTFNNIEEAESFAKYMALKFPRFMMKHTLSGMNISTQNFQFVPFLDYNIRWTDNMLYDRYHLSNDEIDYIESLIRPME